MSSLASKKRTVVLAARIKVLGGRIEAQKRVIARERDKLRSLISDAEEIVDSLDEGIDMIDGGLRELQNGLDRMSEYV